MAEILDSGTRREFVSGAVRDIGEGKGRCDLLPLEEVSSFLKYWDDVPNQFKGIPPLDCVNMFLQPPHRLKTDQDLIFTALESFGAQNNWDIPTMILEMSIHMENGCAKYGENNWRKGIPAHCFIDSAVRHYLKWYRGDDDEPHDRAFVWNLLCLLWTLKNRPECNDLWENEDGDGR